MIRSMNRPHLECGEVFTPFDNCPIAIWSERRQEWRNLKIQRRGCAQPPGHQNLWFTSVASKDNALSADLLGFDYLRSIPLHARSPINNSDVYDYEPKSEPKSELKSAVKFKSKSKLIVWACDIEQATSNRLCLLLGIEGLKIAWL